MTPLQIAVMASAFGAFAANQDLVVWGSWHRAASELAEHLWLRGSGPGTTEIEYQNLGGRRRGKPNRRVYFYTLASERARGLAARCAWAVLHTHGRRATWKDVPEILSGSGGAKRCPGCSCTVAEPCTIRWDGGQGQCVPAGVFGFEQCTLCQLEAA